MKNKINMTFLAFLAWMATLLAITCVNAFGQCDYLESNNNMGHVEHLPPAYKTASAVAMAKAIVWNNIHFVTVDSPTDYGREWDEHGVRALEHATCLLQTYAYLTEEEMEMALGVLGYRQAIEWCMHSSVYGKIIKPAPHKRPEGVCCGD